MRGARQVLQHDVRVVGVEPRLLDRRAGDELGVVHQILVDRRVLRHEEDQRAVALAAHAAGLLPEARHRAGVAREDADVEVADVDAELQRVGRNDRRDAPLEEVLLELPPLGGQEAAAVGLDLLLEFGVAVRDRPPQALHLLPRAAEADRAHAGRGRGADDRDRDRRGSFAEAGRARALDERRVDQVEVAPRARRAVLVDHPERPVEKRLHMLAGVADGRRAADELRPRAVHGADAQQASEDVGDVRAEGPAVGVHLVHDDVLEAAQKVAPAPVVVGQDARVQHVGVGDHKVGALHDLGALLARRVAVEGAQRARAERGLEQRAERALLVARKGLGRVEQQHAERRLAFTVVAQDRQQESQRLARGRARDQHRVLAGRHGLEGLGLVRVELLDAALAQHGGQARVEALGERRERRFLGGHHLVLADLPLEAHAQLRLDRVDMGVGRLHVFQPVQFTTRRPAPSVAKSGGRLHRGNPRVMTPEARGFSTVLNPRTQVRVGGLKPACPERL